MLLRFYISYIRNGNVFYVQSAIDIHMADFLCSSEISTVDCIFMNISDQIFLNVHI